MYKSAAKLYKLPVGEGWETAPIYIRSNFLYIRITGMYRKIVRLYRRGVRNRSRRAELYRFFRGLYIHAGREGVRRWLYTVSDDLYIHWTAMLTGRATDDPALK